MKNQNELVVRFPIQITPCDVVYMWQQHGDVYQQMGDYEPTTVASYGDTPEGRTQAGQCMMEMQQLSDAVTALRDPAVGYGKVG